MTKMTSKYKNDLTSTIFLKKMAKVTPKDEKEKIYVSIVEFMFKCFFFMFYLINKMHLSKINILIFF